MEKSIVEFLRKKDYVFVKELGRGACGRTVLLRDDELGENYVCKKYAPFSELHREELYSGFVREIKLLHQLLHPNIVRIFNSYLYQESHAGYILMEYVDGCDIEKYLKENPERSNEVFEQTIAGFSHLEKNKILHRDIRPGNVMVADSGAVKIIDLGFGKRVQHSADFDKSITLNWWCTTPEEFSRSVYDFSTEVYFVGKLFEKIITQYGIEHFKYGGILSKMCVWAREERVKSFLDVGRAVAVDLFQEIEFSDGEIHSYRLFADSLSKAITKIESGAKYVDDIELIQTQLEAAYRSCMLEDTIPESSLVVRKLITGAYYSRGKTIQVWVLKDFIRLMRSSSHEKQRIIMANLYTRLDSIERYGNGFDDDIPF